MAYTKIHAIKSTLDKALAYIENEKKTEGSFLVSGYHCDPESAYVEFQLTDRAAHIRGEAKEKNANGTENVAYHMIQSFSPEDSIDPEKAHEIGKKWADQFLGGKYEYVISTHVDKNHIHNHIIFNARSFVTGKKIVTKPYETAAQLRRINDRLCREYGLNVIQAKGKGKEKSWYEAEMEKQGKSWKAKLRFLIDQTICESGSMQEFKQKLSEKGVSIKEGKYLSYALLELGQERYCRGKTIGEDYTEGKISERIKEQRKPVSYEQAQTLWEKLRALDEMTGIKEDRRSLSQRVRAVQQLADAINISSEEGIHTEAEFSNRLGKLKNEVVQLNQEVDGLHSLAGEISNVISCLYIVQNDKYDVIQYETNREIKSEAKDEMIEVYRHAKERLDTLKIPVEMDTAQMQIYQKKIEALTIQAEKQKKEIEKRIAGIQSAQRVIAKEARDSSHS